MKLGVPAKSRWGGLDRKSEIRSIAVRAILPHHQKQAHSLGSQELESRAIGQLRRPECNSWCVWMLENTIEGHYCSWFLGSLGMMMLGRYWTCRMTFSRVFTDFTAEIFASPRIAYKGGACSQAWWLVAPPKLKKKQAGWVAALPRMTFPTRSAQALSAKQARSKSWKSMQTCPCLTSAWKSSLRYKATSVNAFACKYPANECLQLCNVAPWCALHTKYLLSWLSIDTKAEFPPLSLFFTIVVHVKRKWGLSPTGTHTTHPTSNHAASTYLTHICHAIKHTGNAFNKTHLWRRCTLLAASMGPVSAHQPPGAGSKHELVPAHSGAVHMERWAPGDEPDEAQHQPKHSGNYSRGWEVSLTPRNFCMHNLLHNTSAFLPSWNVSCSRCCVQCFFIPLGLMFWFTFFRILCASCCMCCTQKS